MRNKKREKDMKKDTKAQAHIEIILSFVIFIGFLIFMLMFLNPFAKTQSVDLISSVEKSILNNVSTNIGKMSVIGDDGTNIIPLGDYPTKFIEKTDTLIPNKKCTLYFSNEIFTTNTQTCNFSNYTLGVYSTEKMINYERISALKINYNTSYEGLKSSLGITSDFAFSVEDLNGVEISGLSVTKNIPSGIEVQSRNIPIRTINNTGDIQELILNIRVW